MGVRQDVPPEVECEAQATEQAKANEHSSHVSWQLIRSIGLQLISSIEAEGDARQMSEFWQEKLHDVASQRCKVLLLQTMWSFCRPDAMAMRMSKAWHIDGLDVIDSYNAAAPHLGIEGRPKVIGFT
jgi:hypothetical protein